jgi:hypothetical protein
MDPFASAGLDKLKDFFGKGWETLTGALGGWLSGILISVWSAGAVQSIFNYQAGWYGAYAPYLLFPLLVFVAYVFLLYGKWTSAIAFMAIVLIAYVAAHEEISIDSRWRFIEFVALWTFVAQLAATTTLGAWKLFWDRYEFIRKNP